MQMDIKQDLILQKTNPKTWCSDCISLSKKLLQKFNYWLQSKNALNNFKTILFSFKSLISRIFKLGKTKKIIK